ncbi:TetR/AcrR family transcriptional regulator [Paractinoplanes lichenicola]|uniref:TetR/AcrR family transcriptional regulator n=1 Tax=Paractinoplanes lichenicola TaxID=2802976 RepID=A0ABS1VZ32_9ACTN|nr:TetR/AcrR family transcriptional regulator [Actinoplanes lichenicola]MBL7259704.1 TetR/AcrR family transcriptional regulator [Actinoplanes lichenicola]
MRADAERSTMRILEAAETVLAADPNAPMERIADAAGLARATVHRRFPTRKVLLEALVEQVNERYLLALQRARVDAAPPAVALHRLTESLFELKVSHRFGIQLTGDVLSPAVIERLDLVFTRLHAAGEITAVRPQWCRQVFRALVHEVDELPPDAPELGPADSPGARADLLVRTLLGALNA